LQNKMQVCTVYIYVSSVISSLMCYYLPRRHERPAAKVLIASRFLIINCTTSAIDWSYLDTHDAHTPRSILHQSQGFSIPLLSSVLLI